MTNVIQNFYGSVYGSVAGRDVEHALQGPDSVIWAAAAQDDFHKRTGIWCPVEAQEALLALRGKSQSPSAVKNAWEARYIAWDADQERLRYAVSWIHFVLALGFAILLGTAVYYMVPVGLASAPTARWMGTFGFWAGLFLVELMVLDRMLLRPWKVARIVRADAEHADKVAAKKL